MKPVNDNLQVLLARSENPVSRAVPARLSEASAKESAHWLPTATGGALPVSPAPGDVDFRALAAQLAKLARWAGATLAPYSVAQHSVVVSDLLWAQGEGPRLALAGLLHDAHEVASGDVPEPWKRALFDRSPEAARAWLQLCDDFDKAVLSAAGVLRALSGGERRILRRADEVAAATEARDLLPAPRYGAPPRRFTAAPDRKRLRPWPWETAEATFLDRFDRLVAAHDAMKLGGDT